MRFLQFVLPTLALLGAFESAQACTASNVYLYSARFEAEGPMTCLERQGLHLQHQQHSRRVGGRPDRAEAEGRAGWRSRTSKPFYVAKPGYTGPDEFAYAFIGKDQYGGPMRIVIKRTVTVVP